MCQFSCHLQYQFTPKGTWQLTAAFPGLIMRGICDLWICNDNLTIAHEDLVYKSAIGRLVLGTFVDSKIRIRLNLKRCNCTVILKRHWITLKVYLKNKNKHTEHDERVAFLTTCTKRKPPNIFQTLISISSVFDRKISLFYRFTIFNIVKCTRTRGCKSIKTPVCVDLYLFH